MLAMLVAVTVAATADGGADGGTTPRPSSGEIEAQNLLKERLECGAGQLTSCLWGSKRRQSETERLQLLEKACQIGPSGCVSLAYALAGGYDRVPLDVARARALAERLCSDPADSMDVGGACLVLAQLIPEPAHRHDLLLRACRLGWMGYRGQIAANYWLPPGQPAFETNCRSPERLGRPWKPKSRHRR